VSGYRNEISRPEDKAKLTYEADWSLIDLTTIEAVDLSRAVRTSPCMWGHILSNAATALKTSTAATAFPLNAVVKAMVGWLLLNLEDDSSVRSINAFSALRPRACTMNLLVHFWMG
jgi:hypothetical protein